MGQEILSLLRERIDSGVTDRQILLTEMLAEASQAGEESATESLPVVAENLIAWIDLARHLYA